MAGLDAIKGVLLDVGDTLTAPRGGRWNPRFDFEDTLREFGLDHGTDEDLARAIAEGDAYLHRMAAKGNRDDYHRVLLGALGLEANDDLLAALDAPLHFSRIIEVFPDVLPALTAMKERGFVLGNDRGTRPSVQGVKVRPAKEDLLCFEPVDLLRSSAYFDTSEVAVEPAARVLANASDQNGVRAGGCESSGGVSQEGAAQSAALLRRGHVQATHSAREVVSAGARASPDEADQPAFDLGDVEELVRGQRGDGAMPTTGAVVWRPAEVEVFLGHMAEEGCE